MSPAARHPSPRTYLVSACLLGERCRYDGSSNDSPSVRDFLKGHTVVPVCPEVLGGLPVPRMGCDLSSGDGQAVWQGTARVLRHDGLDLTDAFVSGAQRSRAAAPTASWAILKARSPSCGCHRTWIDGEVREGMGVFAALLQAQGAQICSDEDITEGRVTQAGSVPHTPH